MKVNSIVLCGNNLETWLVASFLTRRVPNIDLTILETNKEYSNKNRSSGEFLSLFIQLLEIDESDWMHKADAIFTAGSEYHKFSEKNNHFIVPNGMYELPSDQQTRLDLRTLFDVKNENSKKVNSKDILNYVTYNSWLIHKNKMTDVFKTTEGLKAPFTTSHNFTYSFSEEKMISFLKEYFCTGVRIITNESSEETSGVTVIRNEKNEIQEIKIPSYTLKADLYIDCTSNSILLNKEENEFVEVSTFIDDRKDSFTIQYKNEKEQIKNVRNSISLMAIDEGYLRKIPSWNQCSFDVVYSSKFSEEGDVEKSISKLFDHEITHNTEVLNGSYFN
ncbi:MAG: tryptophan 7-halogenase, partial [Aquiluna sp.]